ncbi:MAG: hypothetical protein LBC42_01340 [Puniceicoccales bacterium]|jgi:hypothetical protein|nr:hypothetical protein [Puniceicoccales bacterium]
MDLLLLFGFFPPLLLLLLLRWNPLPRQTILLWLRSVPVNASIFFAAIAAFLWKILHVGDADFSGPRWVLAVLFATFSLPLLRRNYGFLGVRGLAIFQLLWANRLLSAGAGNFSSPWLLAKVVAYAHIFLALYLIVRPYRLRDWLTGRVK